MKRIINNIILTLKDARLIVLVPISYVLFLGQVTQPSEDLIPITRDSIIERARLAAEHTWTCRESNTKAPCVTKSSYRCDFSAGETVTGIPYDWGGMDAPAIFDRKLAEGQAAGSHSRHGVTNCTAGMDCSGFVSWCWGQDQKDGTSTIRRIAGRAKYNWYSDMKIGDALNKPGSHIVLFHSYREDGNPNVYEAMGSKGKVVFNQSRTWASLQGYYPLQYLKVIEE